MLPKFGVNAIRLGRLKLGWLKRLKASARNCSLAFSRSAMLRCRERSISCRPGPITPLREALPNEYKAGSEKTAVANHCRGLRAPSFGLPETLGRCAGPAPMLA